ncbi:hypothetical protein [Brucella thiophenivorans]|nr:hypothetical protein [Brucella thiophenivorans]
MFIETHVMEAQLAAEVQRDQMLKEHQHKEMQRQKALQKRLSKIEE